MGTYNHSYTSTDNLLRGLRGLTSTVIIGARGTAASYTSILHTLNPKP